MADQRSRCSSSPVSQATNANAIVKNESTDMGNVPETDHAPKDVNNETGPLDDVVNKASTYGLQRTPTSTSKEEHSGTRAEPLEQHEVKTESMDADTDTNTDTPSDAMATNTAAAPGQGQGQGQGNVHNGSPQGPNTNTNQSSFPYQSPIANTNSQNVPIMGYPNASGNHNANAPPGNANVPHSSSSNGLPHSHSHSHHNAPPTPQDVHQNQQWRYYNPQDTHHYQPQPQPPHNPALGHGHGPHPSHMTGPSSHGTPVHGHPINNVPVASPHAMHAPPGHAHAHGHGHGHGPMHPHHVYGHHHSGSMGVMPYGGGPGPGGGGFYDSYGMGVPVGVPPHHQGHGGYYNMGAPPPPPLSTPGPGPAGMYHGGAGGMESHVMPNANGGAQGQGQGQPQSVSTPHGGGMNMAGQKRPLEEAMGDDNEGKNLNANIGEGDSGSGTGTVNESLKSEEFMTPRDGNKEVATATMEKIVESATVTPQIGNAGVQNVIANGNGDDNGEGDGDDNATKEDGSMDPSADNNADSSMEQREHSNKTTTPERDAKRQREGGDHHPAYFSAPVSDKASSASGPPETNPTKSASASASELPLQPQLHFSHPNQVPPTPAAVAPPQNHSQNYSPPGADQRAHGTPSSIPPTSANTTPMNAHGGPNMYGSNYQNYQHGPGGSPEMYDPSYYSGGPPMPTPGQGHTPGAHGAGHYGYPPPPHWQHGPGGGGPPTPHAGYPQGPPGPGHPHGHGPPPQGMYYEGMGEMDMNAHPQGHNMGAPGHDYDRNMYYNHYGAAHGHGHGHGPPPPPGGPGAHRHPHTPYAPPHTVDPHKPHVTPDSRPHGSPHRTGSRHDESEEPGAYTKLVRSSGVRLTDRKKMQNKAWFDRFEELKRYKDAKGDCLVPQKYPPNPSLGTWVNKQRMEYKLLMDHHKSSMTEERLQALQSIGFTWAKRKGQATWDAKFQQLKEYKAAHGDCLIPTKYSKDLALGRWVSTQREQYRLWKQGDPKTKMNNERASKLNEVGFVWRLQF